MTFDSGEACDVVVTPCDFSAYYCKFVLTDAKGQDVYSLMSTNTVSMFHSTTVNICYLKNPCPKKIVHWIRCILLPVSKHDFQDAHIYTRMDKLKDNHPNRQMQRYMHSNEDCRV